MLIKEAIKAIIDTLEDEIEVAENEIDRIVEWIKDNPGKFDGVTEANRRIAVLTREVEEMYEDLEELNDEYYS